MLRAHGAAWPEPGPGPGLGEKSKKLLWVPQVLQSTAKRPHGTRGIKGIDRSQPVGMAAETPLEGKSQQESSSKGKALVWPKRGKAKQEKEWRQLHFPSGSLPADSLFWV